MIAAREVRYLKRRDIDAEKWNRCIEASPNGLIYAYSLYLDAMCDNWDALVMGDYETVMPLPWRKKWGIRYVYTPPFIQQLGIIGNAQPAQEEDFLKALYKQFRYGSYCFNFLNSKRGTEKTNFILDLSKGYAAISKGYAKNLERNLKKATPESLEYRKGDSISTAVWAYYTQYHIRFPHLTASDFKRFESLCKMLHWDNEVLVREVVSGAQLLAIALLLKKKNRLYLIMPTTLEAGRKTSANHFLLDQLIQEFAGQDLILDFEGSDLPGVYHFYKNFGAVNQPYYLHHWNHLPIPLRWIKK